MDFTKIIILIIVSTVSNAQSPAASRADSLINMTNIFKDGANATQVIRATPQVILSDNPTLCVETIILYFQGKFNLIVALETEFETATNQSLKISNVIAKGLVHPSNESTTPALNICKSQYKNIVDTINETAELLNQQNVIDAYYKFSTMIPDIFL